MWPREGFGQPNFHEGGDDGPQPEHERPRRQRDPEALQQVLQPYGRQHTEPEPDERGDEEHDPISSYGARHARGVESCLR